MGNRKMRAVHRVAINSDPASAAEAEKLAKLWYDVHKEDHAMYERLQAGEHPTSPPTGEVLSPRYRKRPNCRDRESAETDPKQTSALLAALVAGTRIAAIEHPVEAVFR
jgi:hypothetical protein